MGRTIAGAMLVVALLCMTVQASGQLLPMSWGFPNAVQTSTTTAWQQDTANAFSFQDSDIGFPNGPYSFPSIHQTSIQSQSISHTEFSQTTEFAAIGYPYVSVGPGPYAGFACGY
jgi:hypothetical protein